MVKQQSIRGNGNQELVMEIPPKMLDGAVVLHYVMLSTSYRSTGATKHFIDGHEAESPLALAICQCADDDGA
jgi:hypothetical protein